MDIKEKQQLAMVNAARSEYGNDPLDQMKSATDDDIYNAFVYTVEQHEATKQKLIDFQQEISDVVEQAQCLDQHGTKDAYAPLQRFIIPSTETDQLVEVLIEIDSEYRSSDLDYEKSAKSICAKLAERGLKIVEEKKKTFDPCYFGTPEHAIRFALEVHDDTLQTYEFLKAWSEGDLVEWPEFIEWLKNSSHT